IDAVAVVLLGRGLLVVAAAAQQPVAEGAAVRVAAVLAEQERGGVAARPALGVGELLEGGPDGAVEGLGEAAEGALEGEGDGGADGGLGDRGGGAGVGGGVGGRPAHGDALAPPLSPGPAGRA